MFSKDSTISKLILLHVLEKMEIPVTESTILDICTSRNDWINYMECKEIIYELIQANLIYKTDGNEREQKYNITYDGRDCLSHFYHRIPNKLYEEITEYVKENRSHYKRSQEYLSDYKKNNDGSYTVYLKIQQPIVDTPLYELKIISPTRKGAIEACKKWTDLASSIYEYTFENLIDES